jgi:hypothetical protein
MHINKYFSHTHAHIHADNTYVHVNKYIHITYTHIETYKYTHSYMNTKNIFDQNILNRKIFSSKNIFTVKKLFKSTCMHT